MEEDIKRKRMESIKKEFNGMIKKKQEERQASEYVKEQKALAKKKQIDARRKRAEAEDRVLIIDHINNLVKSTTGQMVANQAATLKL